ncbi:MAG: response regulator transcription factor [Oceanipulchritudo sp.]
MKNPISLILAEDHLLVREGIHKLIEAENDLTVVGEAKTGHEVVDMATRLRPDIVVMDIAMPLLNGLEACRQLREKAPGTRVLILSAHGEDAYVEKALEVGAAGFLLKHAPGNALNHAIREVHAGRPYFSPSILRRYKDPQSGLPGGQATLKHPPLTLRESEVLQLIAEGKANKETADILDISIKTVEKHRANLMRKLNIHDTAGLTRHAIRSGVIDI